MFSKMAQKIDSIALTTNWPVGPVNVYLIYGEKLTLIDTGLKNDQSWKELNEALHERGLDIRDIEQIILTHHHSDHAGLLERIIEKNPVPIYAHENARPYIERDVAFNQWSKEFFRELFTEFGVSDRLAQRLNHHKKKKLTESSLVLEKELKEGDGVPGLSSWKVIETKGHSQDHISLYCSDSRVLICGDHIIKGTPAGIFLDAPPLGEERAKPLIQYIDNLKKCLHLPVDQTFSGHGPTITNLDDAIHEQLERIENRASRVKNILKKHSGTGFEITQEMYPKRFQQSLGLFVSEITSVLDLLQQRNEVGAIKKRGKYIYHLLN
ncbi:MBL fold metallo-hydrolase [Pueribacillus theae]|uniref:MBL fold metallo-hydrolase n=1 Tax=Pueribacillus theae TaxID=2171751 RepID=UPI001F0C5DCE|nr:MBL fold metallo-hydrolase [Pueribacillus theae]